MERLGEIVGDEAEAIGEKRAAVLRHLPAGQIASETVHYGQIKLRRQRKEEIIFGRVDDLLDRLVDIADESHAGVGNHLNAAGKPAVGHEVLHDLDRIGVPDLDPTHLIECNGIPEADQADFMTRVVVEQNRLSSPARR